MLSVLFTVYYLFTSGDVGKLRHFRFLCEDDELPIILFLMTLNSKFFPFPF